MKNVVLLLTGAFALSAIAVPTVSDVTVSQPSGRPAIVVSYRLTGDAAAIVTATVITNSSTGAGFAAGEVRTVTGDLNRRVRATTGAERREFTWDWRKDIPRDIALPEGVSVRVRAWALDAPPPVMVVDPAGTADDVCFYVSTNALPKPVSDVVYKREKILLVRIPAGDTASVLGSPTGQYQRGADEVQHLVTISDDFYIGVYPVTCDQYKRWTGACPRDWSAQTEEFHEMPVFGVSYDTLRGSTALGIDWPQTGHEVAEGSVLWTLRDRTGVDFDLPTEAQWEFACRAGTTAATYVGDNSSAANVGKVAWNYNNAVSSRKPINSRIYYPYAVGQKQPNDFGLHDILGNCFEWCLDWYGDYPAGCSFDDVGPKSGEKRVRRGGSYANSYYQCTASGRFPVVPSDSGEAGSFSGESYGFRLVCPAAFSF